MEAFVEHHIRMLRKSEIVEVSAGSVMPPGFERRAAAETQMLGIHPPGQHIHRRTHCFRGSGLDRESGGS